MKNNKVSPLEFMMANRKIIIKAVQNEQNHLQAWNVLKKELPDMKKVTKYNTFKSYIKILLIVDKELEEKEQLKEELEMNELSNKKLIQENESIKAKLKTLVPKNSSLKKETLLKNKGNTGNEKMPKQVHGWGVQFKTPYYRLFKKINGKVKWIHVGRNWDQNVAIAKITNFNEKVR